MKILKLTLIAAILSFAMISYAGVKPQKEHAQKLIKISLTQAVKEPGLVAAMHDQLTMAFLKVEPQGQYTALVKYNLNVYKIYGTRTAWIKFFISTPKPLPVSTKNFN